MSEDEVQEFLEWKASKSSKMDKAFWELDRVLNRSIKYKFDETMSVESFRVLANALLALKNEVCR